MQVPPNGSPKWQNSAWKDLLRTTIQAFDSLPETPKWSFGGGTALAVHFGHRISYDIDAFVSSTEVIRDLSPNRNPTVKALLAGGAYQYPGNYLKLEFPEGEIDFISASARTEEAYQDWDFEGRCLRLETPWEIGIKKIFFRPSTFKIRDAFDLAVIVDRTPEKLAQYLPDVEDRLPKLLQRLAALRATYERRVTVDLNPTESGRAYLSAASVDRLIQFLQAHQPKPPLDETPNSGLKI